MTNHQHIFLTGFMGSGKSTYGRKLANLMNLNFIDLDTYIEEEQKLSVTELFENIGEEKFREIEAEALKIILQEKKQQVISLGGGTICFYDNLKQIKENGILIYLELSASALFTRILPNVSQRPLLKNYKEEELLLFIEEKLASRQSYYNQANLTVNGLNLSAQQLYKEISEFRQKNNS
jgi:shikimate kinase